MTLLVLLALLLALPFARLALGHLRWLQMRRRMRREWWRA